MIGTLLALAFALNASPDAAPKDEWSADNSRITGWRFARCIIYDRKSKGLARKAILGDFSAAQMISKFSALMDENCLAKVASGTGGMKLPFDTIRFILSDEMVREDFPQGLPPLTTVPPLAHRDYAADLVAAYPNSPNRPDSKTLSPKGLEIRDNANFFTYMSHFGECVVRADPNAAFQLLSSDPETSQEGAAFGSLQSGFDACTAMGKTFKLNKQIVRGTIAFNAYRLGSAARAMSAKKAR